MKMRRVFGLAVNLLVAVAVSGCGGGGGGGASSNVPPPAVTYSATGGVVQKGPLIQGSTVTAQELSTTLVPTGKQYSYQTTSDFGQFNPNSAFTSQYIGVNATGYYFDESAGSVSAGAITLNSYSDLSSSTVLNVNLLTTLAYQRIQNLVANSHLSFAAAQSQAEREVLTALNIPAVGALGHFDSLDISKTTDGDKILAAVSGLFTYGNTSANLASLVASVQSDIGTNGAITSTATKAVLAASAHAMNPATIAANLTQRYSSLGFTFSAADISNWIDSDGDGVVGHFEFQVTDASQSSAFTFPSYVTNPNAGTSVSVSVGRMTVNGVPASGATQIQSGDAIAVMPPTGTFPSGMLTSYLMSGSTRIAKVSFVSGLVSIAVTPADSSLPVGLNQQMTATGTFTDGGTADITHAVDWSAPGAPSDPGPATVSPYGIASGRTPGMTTITAKSGSISGSTSLNVVAAVVSSITIAPSPVSVGVGAQRQLTATGHYSDGTNADVTSTATWTTGSTAIATVTGGLVTGVAFGNTSVTASSGSTSGSATVNVSTNQWTSVPGNGVVQGHTATLLQNGKVLVAFGQGAIACCSNGTQLYDPATNTWSGGPSANQGIYYHAAALLPNGKVLLTGGDMNGPANLNTYLYDPVSNTFAAGAPLSQRRYAAAAVLLNTGKVLLVSDATAVLYDYATDSWSAAGTLIHPRGFPIAALLPDGKVLVTGADPDLTTPLASAEIYDPVTNSWSSAGTMAHARMHHTAVLLKTGKVLVMGGTDGTNTLAAAELYDPSTNSWAPAASMANARIYHTAALLSSGQVLVAGGIGAFTGTVNYLSSAELYNPATDSWSAAATMLSPGYHQTATVLQGGAVLVVGTDNEVYW